MSRVDTSSDTPRHSVTAQTTVPHHPAVSQIVRVRKWKVFPGKNTFLCDGICICAPDWYGFLCCLIIYVVIGVLFFTFDCRYLAVHVSPAIPVVGGVLYVYILGALCATSLTDPGIIPRATPTEAEDKQNFQGKGNLQNDVTESPRCKEVEIGGRKFTLQYCNTCHIYRPPRSTHCRHCDNCVERFDHHCPMIGNCIGKRNYRQFYLFLSSVIVFAGYVLGCNIAVIVLKAKDSSTSDAAKDSVATVIEMIVAVAALFVVGVFFSSHSYLVAMEMTTNEFLKKTYSARKHDDSRNPYRHKFCCLNCCHILCGPKHPSLIDRRGLTQIITGPT